MTPSQARNDLFAELKAHGCTIQTRGRKGNDKRFSLGVLGPSAHLAPQAKAAEPKCFRAYSNNNTPGLSH